MSFCTNVQLFVYSLMRKVGLCTSSDVNEQAPAHGDDDEDAPLTVHQLYRAYKKGGDSIARNLSFECILGRILKLERVAGIKHIEHGVVAVDINVTDYSDDEQDGKN